jgi:YD repeat-containing protein
MTNFTKPIKDWEGTERQTERLPPPMMLVIAAAALLLSICCQARAQSDETAPTLHCTNRLHTVVDLGTDLGTTNTFRFTNTFSYDAYGRVIAETDSNGRNMTFVYDSEDHPATVTWTITEDLPGFGSTNVFALGRHHLAETDSQGTTYEYDNHQYLVRAVGTNFVATRTIVDGNIVVYTKTGYPTVTYTYTSIDHCVKGALNFLGRQSRNWPATATSFGGPGPPEYVTFAYGFDDLGRVTSRTATITIGSRVTYTFEYYTYE